MVSSLCFVHNRVKDRLVIGPKIKEKHIRGNFVHESWIYITFMCACHAKPGTRENEAIGTIVQ